MIELPDHLGPSSAVPALLDFGVTLRPATGGPVQKIQRAGSRYRMEYSLPPMGPEDARVYVSRLIEAKRKGELTMPIPLGGLHQGSPGLPVVDGAGQAGTTINLRGAIPGHLFREGYWINLFDADGQRYLFNVRETKPVGPDGRISIRIEPPLRRPHPDGSQAECAEPKIEGFIDGGEYSWRVNPVGITEIVFTIEEAA